MTGFLKSAAVGSRGASGVASGVEAGALTSVLTGVLTGAVARVAAGVIAGVAAGALSAGPASAATAAPGTLRIGYGQACSHHAGTVAFVLENRDRHRHTVSISGGGLSPAADAGSVPASRTVVVQFDIGAKSTTVSVSVDRGAPRTHRLKGCPHGDGDQGVIAVRGEKAQHQPESAPPKHVQAPDTAPRRNLGQGSARGPKRGTDRSAPSRPRAAKPAPARPAHPKSGPAKSSPSHHASAPPPVNTA